MHPCMLRQLLSGYRGCLLCFVSSCWFKCAVLSNSTRYKAAVFLWLALCCAADASDVPDGDWFCWFCAKERGVACHPAQPFSVPRGAQRCVMLASDDLCEIFYRTKVTREEGDMLHLRHVDIKV